MSTANHHKSLYYYCTLLWINLFYIQQYLFLYCLLIAHYIYWRIRFVCSMNVNWQAPWHMSWCIKDDGNNTTYEQRTWRGRWRAALNGINENVLWAELTGRWWRLRRRRSWWGTSLILTRHEENRISRYWAGARANSNFVHVYSYRRGESFYRHPVALLALVHATIRCYQSTVEHQNA